MRHESEVRHTVIPGGANLMHHNAEMLAIELSVVSTTAIISFMWKIVLQGV